MPTRWASIPEPSHISLPAHGSSVVTCLKLHRGRIITASDDCSIHVYSITTGEHIFSLLGHEGGVWTLDVTENILVSGSTDRTMRIWDLATGRCTHTFGGHTSTVRAIAIVNPELIDVEDGDGFGKEKWPKRPLIVTGSRDHSIRVWTLPQPDEPEYHSTTDDYEFPDVEQNLYHRLHLEGHDHAIRALAAQGRTVVSGSFDCTVRVWDIINGTCKWVLIGHTQKVYSISLDLSRHQACSGSMDGNVRIWNVQTGQCLHTLTGHTSLVGLLGISPSYLVSASADSTLRVWDSDTGQLHHILNGHTGAITCFQHDEFKVLSGSDGILRMWDVEGGTIVRDLLTDIIGVWQVAFEGRWCVAASSKGDATFLDIWDFGERDEPLRAMYDEDNETKEDFDGLDDENRIG